MGGFGFGLGRDEFRRGPGAGERGTASQFASVIVSSFRYKRRELPLTVAVTPAPKTRISRITTDPPLALLCFLKRAVWAVAVARSRGYGGRGPRPGPRGVAVRWTARP